MKIKIISYILTLILQLLLILKLLDSFFLNSIAFIVCLASGLIMNTVKSDNKIIKDIGWGLFFGSITSLVLILGLLILLAYNFRA